MGFLSGGMSFLRFRASGIAPKKLDGDHLDKLDAHHAGKVRLKSPGGIEVGWVAGDHILDVGFVEHKNLLPHALLFGMRIDVNRLPGDLLRAYYAEGLRVMERESENGTVNARQKRLANDAARDKLEEEAKDGRFLKRRAIPVLWDRLTNEVLFGATSTIQADRFKALFKQTFHREVELVSAGKRAFHLAEARGQTRGADDSALSAFVPGITPKEAVWIKDDCSRDFLGNEFLLWLWYRGESGGVIQAADDSLITCTIARSLTLDCPRGLTGQASLTHATPSQMGEATYGIRIGKLPRACGLTVTRNSQVYECSIDAETLGIGAAKLPRPIEDLVDPQAVREDRLAKLRGFIETLDLLYDAFGRVRLGREWEQELAGMQRWLKGKN